MAQRAIALGARTAIRAATSAASAPAASMAAPCSRTASCRSLIYVRPLGSSSSAFRRRQIHATSAAWKKKKGGGGGGAGGDKPADDAAGAAAADPPAEGTADDAAAEPKEPTAYEKEVAEAEKRPGPDGADPTPVPEWQNPRHHNDPQLQKIFFEDFDEGEEPPIVPLPPFSDGSGRVSARQEVRDIADEILHMNMLEVKELADRIGEHFGLEDKPMFGGGGPAAGGGGEGGDGGGAEEEKKEEKTSFDLKLTGFDAKAKIKVIKEVRAAAGLGLKEAKELVEGAPKVIKKDIKMEEAEELKAKLEEIGATVEIV